MTAIRMQEVRRGGTQPQVGVTRDPTMAGQGGVLDTNIIIGGRSHVFGRVLQKGSAVRGAEKAKYHHR